MPEPISVERLAEIREHGKSWLEWPLPAESSMVEQAGRDITDLLAELDRLHKVRDSLAEDAARFAALEEAGVDNWEWYGEAMASLREQADRDDCNERTGGAL